MADIQQPFEKPPLGVGAIVSQTFAILFARFPLFFLIAFALQLVVAVVNLALFDPAALLNPDATGTNFNAAAAAVPLILGLVVSSITTGILVLAAYDAQLGNPSRPSAYIGAALTMAVPLIVLAVVTSVAIALGAVLFILPGLYLAALWAVVTPAIVAEAAGFGALGRSRELTRGYRWSIMGLLLAAGAIIVAVSLVFQVVIGTLFGIGGFGQTTPESVAAVSGFGFQIVSAAFSAIIAAFFAIVSAVLFARLKEIKEGVGYEDLGRVFE